MRITAQFHIPAWTKKKGGTGLVSKMKLWQGFWFCLNSRDKLETINSKTVALIIIIPNKEVALNVGRSFRNSGAQKRHIHNCSREKSEISHNLEGS